MERDLSGLHADGIEQIADQAVHLPARTQRDSNKLLAARAIERLFEQEVRCGDEKVERISQIVGYHPQHLLQFSGAGFCQRERSVERLHSGGDRCCHDYEGYDLHCLDTIDCERRTWYQEIEIDE
jgi:hypothetical protein